MRLANDLETISSLMVQLEARAVTESGGTLN